MTDICVESADAVISSRYMLAGVEADKPKTVRWIQSVSVAAVGPEHVRYIVALCDDGTLWALDVRGVWAKLPGVPQT